MGVLCCRRSGIKPLVLIQEQLQYHITNFEINIIKKSLDDLNTHATKQQLFQDVKNTIKKLFKTIPGYTSSKHNTGQYMIYPVAMSATLRKCLAHSGYSPSTISAYFRRFFCITHTILYKPKIYKALDVL